VTFYGKIDDGGQGRLIQSNRQELLESAENILICGNNTMYREGRALG
jgi:hypothetical protein